MVICKNPTCDRPKGPKTYCSRECQLAMRTRTHGKQIPDIWVEMSTWHRLQKLADAEGITVREYVKDLIDMEVAACV